jgi:hypothetical protein
MIHELLGWPALPLMPARLEEARLAAVGLPINLESPGYRGSGLLEMAAWEEVYGLCAPPPQPTPQQPGSLASVNAYSCAGRCNANDVSGTYCWCDAKCKETYSCCKDYDEFCSSFVANNLPAPAPSDWIDALLASASAPTTVLQLVVSLKDRLHGIRTIDAAEGALIADVIGVASLDAPWPSTEAFEAGLRRYCGVLLRSPQLTLAGAPVPTEPFAGSDTVLVVNGEDRVALCNVWAKSSLAASAQWSCSAVGLVVANSPAP